MCRVIAWSMGPVALPSFIMMPSAASTPEARKETDKSVKTASVTILNFFINYSFTLSLGSVDKLSRTSCKLEARSLAHLRGTGICLVARLPPVDGKARRLYGGARDCHAG